MIRTNCTPQGIKKLFLIFTVLFFALRLSLSANTGDTYYVSKTGNDLNSCTKEEPCLTIQKGFSLLKAGDTLNIKEGIYSDIGSSSEYYNGGVAKSDSSPKPIEDWLLVIDHSGTKENPITIQADPENKGKVILDGKHIYNSNESFIGGVMLKHHDYVHFKNFTIRNVATHGIYNWNSIIKGSISSNNLSEGIHIEGLEIYHVGGGDGDSAIAMNSSKDWIIKNNHIFDIYGKPSNNPARGASGISSYGTINSLIEHNLIENVKNGISINDHYNIPGEELLETEIDFNIIKASKNALYISSKSIRGINQNHIHHNIISTHETTASGIKYMVTNSSNVNLPLQKIEHNLIYGNNSTSTNGIFLTKGSKVNIKGNIILGYKKAIFSAYTVTNPVNIDYSDYNIFDSSNTIALLDAYNKTHSFKKYPTLDLWKNAQTSQSFSLNINNPDTNSITSNKDNLFENETNYTYKDDSPALKYMPDGSNSGPYQFGNEIIGIDKNKGKTYYVSKDGNDIYDCTKEQPCLTIQKGVSLLKAGDTLNIKEGIYSDVGSSSEYFSGGNTKSSTSPSIYNWLVVIENSGTKDKPITIQADPENKGEVILDGGYLGSNSTNEVGGIMLRFDDYIHFKNFTIRNVKGAGIYNWDRAENYRDVEEENKMSYGVLIEGLTIYHVGNVDNLSAIRMDSSKNWIVRNNHLYDIYRDEPFLKEYPKAEQRGAGIQSYGTINALIENNLIEDVWSGIFWKDHYVKNIDTREPIFESEVRFNRINATKHGFQVGVQPDNEAGENYFHHNIVTTNKAEASAIFFNMASVEYTTTALQRIENNILHGNNSNSTAGIILSGTSNVEIKGNIIVGFTNLIVSRYLSNHLSGLNYSDYNIFASFSAIAVLDQYTSSIPLFKRSTLSDWQDSLAVDSITLKVNNPDTHSLKSSDESLFNNYSKFTYKNDSPAIGLMEDGTNAGAYQNGNEIIGLTSKKASNSIPDCTDRTHTVSADALGGGDGSENNPWSLEEAMQNAIAGDIICILPGTYIGSDPKATGEGYKYTPAFKPANSGTKENPIWFVALNPAVSNTEGLSKIYSGATISEQGWPAIGVYQHNYIKFSGIYLDETFAQAKSARDSAPFISWSCTGCELYNYKILGEEHIINNHSGIRIENSRSFKEANGYISGFIGGINNKAGIIIYTSHDVDLGNGIIENVQLGIQIKGGKFSNTKEIIDTIYDIHIHNKIIKNARHAFRLHGPVKGPNGELNYIHNNIVHDVSYIAEFTSSEHHYGEQDGLRIFNNTFYNIKGNDPAALWLVVNYKAEGTIPRDNEFYNNIIHTTKSYWGKYGKAGYDAKYIDGFMKANRNILHNITQFMKGNYLEPLNDVTLESWQELGQDVDSIESDPLFVNADEGDFTLKENSPALTLGRDKTNQYGYGIDSTIPVGAYVSGNEVIGLK